MPGFGSIKNGKEPPARTPSLPSVLVEGHDAGERCLRTFCSALASHHGARLPDQGRAIVPGNKNDHRATRLASLMCRYASKMQRSRVQNRCRNGRPVAERDTPESRYWDLLAKKRERTTCSDPFPAQRSNGSRRWRKVSPDISRCLGQPLWSPAT